METPQTLLRVEALFGTEALASLRAVHILVVGLGAVGGACTEALARSGIGRLTLVDGDAFEASNLNRQPFSAQSLVGQPKASATLARLADIAPTCATEAQVRFVSPDNASELLEAVQPDIVVDAIDDVPAKVALLASAHRLGLRSWSSMGAARKLDPTQLRLTDLSKTAVCPLARVVRQRLRAQGITHGVRCVWSQEQARAMGEGGVLGSYMPVTATAGLLLASDILRALTSAPAPLTPSAC